MISRRYAAWMAWMNVLPSWLDELSQHVVSESGAEFKGEDARAWTRPVVYVFLLNQKALYVGMSKNGAGRIFDPKHSQAIRARAECDKVMMWVCRSRHDAIRAEHMLIHYLRPAYNKNAKTAYINRRMRLARRTGKALLASSTI